MNFVEERIRRDGVVASEDVLKVDAFLNHQIDMELVEACAAEFVRRFAGTPITRVLTIETSGIILAGAVARLLKVPMVIARKTRSMNLDGDSYVAEFLSFEPGRGPRIGKYVMKFSMDSGNADYNPFESFKKAALQPMEEDECAMMVLHPGFVDEYVLTTSYITTQRALEVAMACNPEVPKWCAEHDVQLITYADL